ncbi:MAG: alpha-amylase [Anaerolineaceae bacterium]|nr:alpha-amylase [Anaerolineaceae bacterium]
MSKWWQIGIVYQIYPRSFQDSNGDGVGDLPGITQRLGYLQELGVDAIWISPIYPSPMADFGYDVSDYRDIHPLFGTMADMDHLIQAAHDHNLKLILDFVPNHTSDEHPWFLESRSSRRSPKRDWYIWRDPAPDGGPPNNWLSRFDGQSAWEWDAKTGQYYLHSFLAEQPDLNWRNPELRAAMLDVLRFWFDKGVDGFRVDVSYRVMKDAQFRDNPPNPNWQPGMDPAKQVIETYSRNTPDIEHFNRWLREVADEYEDRVLIGEINLPPHELVKHYGRSLNGFHLPFNFNLIFTPWDAAAVRTLIETYEVALPDGAWPNWVLGNHDQHRIASRVGAAQARVAMMLLLTLRGTPTLYYGDELGMLDGDIAPEQVQDPWEKKVPGLGLGRDPERTPLPWTAVPNAGFCPPDVTPWLPLNADAAAVNVASQQANPVSMLTFTQKLIQLRRETAALNQGSYHSLPAPDGLLAYERRHGEQICWVVLNMTGESKKWELPGDAGETSVLLSTEAGELPGIANGALHLRPNEGLVLSV